ncbi:MAG: hypothetical protein PHO37_09695 [Kiritimatiellae bacterium]|nr:hypothetical protein [Kiritimatiellia bacterium]
MKVCKTNIICVLLLLTAGFSAVAADSAPVAKKPKSTLIVSERAKLEYKLEIYERASANRELAALTQMEQAREKEQEAIALQQAALTEGNDERAISYKKAGKLFMDAARLCGHAAANFDQASGSRQQVETLSTKLNNVQQQRNAGAFKLNLKQQASNAMQQASQACEKAAEVYDKAGDQGNLAAASQQAAVWLEALAAR